MQSKVENKWISVRSTGITDPSKNDNPITLKKQQNYTFGSLCLVDHTCHWLSNGTGSHWGHSWGCSQCVHMKKGAGFCWNTCRSSGWDGLLKDCQASFFQRLHCWIVYQENLTNATRTDQPMWRIKLFSTPHENKFEFLDATVTCHSNFTRSQWKHWFLVTRDAHVLHTFTFGHFFPRLDEFDWAAPVFLQNSFPVFDSFVKFWTFLKPDSLDVIFFFVSSFVSYFILSFFLPPVFLFLIWFTALSSLPQSSLMSVVIMPPAIFLVCWLPPLLLHCGQLVVVSVLSRSWV